MLIWVKPISECLDKKTVADNLKSLFLIESLIFGLGFFYSVALTNIKALPRIDEVEVLLC